MKKIIVNGYFNRNLGDDLLLKSLIDHFPKTVFYIYVNKKYVNSYKKIGNNLRVEQRRFIGKLLLRILMMVRIPIVMKYILKPFDVFVEIGGSIFQQYSNRDTVSKIRSGVQKSGKPYFIIGSNFGPVCTKLYVNNYHNFFRKIDGVTFRDAVSFNLFSDLKSVNLAPDAVLSLESDHFSSHSGDKPYVVITPINVQFTRRIISQQYLVTSVFYEAQMKRLIESLVEIGYDIKIVAFSEAEGDGEAAKRIQHSISPEFQGGVATYVYRDIPQMLKLIAGASRLISGRFHAMILGWLFHKPQLVVTYSNKTKNVIDDLYPEQFFVTTKTLKSVSGADMVKKMNTMDTARLEEIQKNANGQFAQLKAFLQSNSAC